MSWSPLDRLLGPSVRRIPDDNAGRKTLFLTFDDGPDPASTPQVLKALAALGVPATFFVIAQRASAERGLLSEIRGQGHGVGNHSLDHRFEKFFSGKAALLDWIKNSEDVLAGTLGVPTVGFRPPAGVRTPELHWALRRLELPLVMWKRRFYDAAMPWAPARALRSLAGSESGDIILLHDAQAPSRLPGFLRTLAAYADAARKAGYEFRPLTRKLCAKPIAN